MQSGPLASLPFQVCGDRTVMRIKYSSDRRVTDQRYRKRKASALSPERQQSSMYSVAFTLAGGCPRLITIINQTTDNRSLRRMGQRPDLANKRAQYPVIVSFASRIVGHTLQV